MSRDMPCGRDSCYGLAVTASLTRGRDEYENLWLSVGFVGQAFFSMRFLVQWIASEKRKESVIPISFWFFSIGGLCKHPQQPAD
jgi:lipid-A-disaccharide synthase-like uncharacterized protein